jgi:uncharacterized protein DUF6283
VPHRRRPCVECPWRHDSPPGQFDADRYAALADTTGTPGAEAHLFAPMFVRLAIATGRLDPRVLQPAPDWPPLFHTYQEMATTQARTTQPANPPAPPNPVPATDLEVGPIGQRAHLAHHKHTGHLCCLDRCLVWFSESPPSERS